MDLIRKMSGLRSSQDLSAAVEQSIEEEEWEESSSRGGEGQEEKEEVEEVGSNDILLHAAERDDGDVFEDAAAALGQPYRQQHADSEEEDGEDGEQRLSSANDDQEARSSAPAAAPASPIRVPQPGFLEADGSREEEDEDGTASHGSGESFDSALERMAASSEAGFDSASSPKMSSPVGSFTQGPVLLGNPPSALSPAQQGALIRLNEMISGDSSMDTSVIDNSTREEFKSRVTRLAHSRGQSEEDLSFVSIVDALLPLVPEKLSEDPQVTGPEDSVGTNEEVEGQQGRVPKAKLFAEEEEEEERVFENGDDHAKEVKAEHGDDPAKVVEAENGDGPAKEVNVENGDDPDKEVKAEHGDDPAKEVKTENRDDLAKEGKADNGDDPAKEGTIENGVDSPKEVKAASGNEKEASDDQVEPPIIEEEASFAGDKKEAAGVPVISVPDTNGDAEKRNGEVDSLDEVPLKFTDIRSDSDDSALFPHSENWSASAKLKVNGNRVEHSSPAQLLEDSTIITDSSGKVDDSQTSEAPQTFPAASDSDDVVQNSSQANGETNDEALGGTHEEEEEEDDDEEENDNEEDEDEDNIMETSEALAELIRAAQSAGGGDAAPPPSMGSAGPSLPARPTRPVRSSLPSLEPAARVAQQPRSTGAATVRSSSSIDEGQANGEPADGNEETREKLQSIRVKFLRLALRLGQSPHNVVVAQVLYRLGLAEQLRGGRSTSRNTAFSFDRASSIAEEQERAGPEELDFACTIMMLGKTGVGKSATINSIFDEAKTQTNAFGPATNKVQVITGHVHGIKVRVIDTPGLLPSVVDQRHNERIMASVKGFIKKQSPDIVLYFDRLDMQSRDYGDLPLLRTITDTFGAAVWFNAIVVLTHASSAPPDGPNGLPLSYEMFVAQRSHVVQQTIRQAAGDMRLMNPVSLVENHTACRVNRSGERVLPNGQVWKPQLLLLCFASKILAEANSLLKLQDNTPGKPFGQRTRVPPLPFLLSSLLQSRTPMKMPDEQVGDDNESDEELEEDDSSDEEEEDYDQLPPFRRLAKEEIAELDEENRANYYEELAERERLFQKKQWKEELKRRREMKKRMAEAPTDQAQFGPDDGLEEEARSATVPVPMPDMALPPSFDSDNPSHRYRYLETANQWLVRPVLETHGWDHDNGYDGMSVEKMFFIGDKVPTSVSGQITKDKKEANLNLEVASSLKHGEGKVTLAGLDVQTVGKDLAYTLRSETRFSNFKGNKTTGGLALTLLGDTVSAGMKIEDRLLVGKRVKLVVNGGAITGGGDVAFGGSLEATLRDKEYPLSRTLSTLGVSIMDWHGDLAVGGNLQSQFILGKTMMVGRANLNNRGAGQISIRASSSEQLQMTLIGILPIVRAIVNRLFGQSQE